MYRWHNAKITGRKVGEVSVEVVVEDQVPEATEMVEVGAVSRAITVVVVMIGVVAVQVGAHLSSFEN